MRRINDEVREPRLRILMEASAPNDECAEFPDYCVVELTVKEAEHLLRLRELCAEMKSADSGFDSAKFFNYSADYISWGIAELMFSKDTLAAVTGLERKRDSFAVISTSRRSFTDEYDKRVEEHNAKVADGAEHEKIDTDDLPGLEGERIVVDEDSFRFEAYLKHTDLKGSSEMFHKSKLEAFLRYAYRHKVRATRAGVQKGGKG